MIWKSDDTLLRRDKPDQFGDNGKGSTFVRATADGNKVIEREGPAVVDYPCEDPELLKAIGIPVEEETGPKATLSRIRRSR